MNKPIALQPKARHAAYDITPEEWRMRVDLAAAYRLARLEGWDDLIYTHITARVPGNDDHFLAELAASIHEGDKMPFGQRAGCWQFHERAVAGAPGRAHPDAGGCSSVRRVRMAGARGPRWHAEGGHCASQRRAAEGTYFARLQVTVPTPPLDAVGVMYFSSSLSRSDTRRFCSVAFQLGNVALSTLKVSDLSEALNE